MGDRVTEPKVVIDVGQPAWQALSCHARCLLIELQALRTTAGTTAPSHEPRRPADRVRAREHTGAGDRGQLRGSRPTADRGDSSTY
jgi:hypothetical protein